MHSGRPRRTPSFAETEYDEGRAVDNVAYDAHRVTGLVAKAMPRSPLADTPHDSKEAAVKVFLRVRYQNEPGKCVSVRDNLQQIDIGDRTFSFDEAGDETTTQEEVFEKVGRPIADAVINGFNGTIFAYGQTGSGKTHTMHGPPGQKFDASSGFERGLTPRILQARTLWGPL